MRGLAASIRRSARRLKAIAAERAVAMQSRIPSQSRGRPRQPSGPRAARAAPSRAKGSAKSVWLNLIIPRMSVIRLKTISFPQNRESIWKTKRRTWSHTTA